mmetsp:Transcript_28750/g.51153  ORF Transcript_28750/g.51153 Transcript_28750/m.51153 type:complete len:101 (+) Transcript_28750:646-948(+)
MPEDPTNFINRIDDPRFLITLAEEAGFEDVKAFEDLYTFNMSKEELLSKIESNLSIILSQAPPEALAVWRAKTVEIIDYYQVERKELISFKTLGIRAQKS